MSMLRKKGWPRRGHPYNDATNAMLFNGNWLVVNQACGSPKHQLVSARLDHVSEHVRLCVVALEMGVTLAAVVVHSICLIEGTVLHHKFNWHGAGLRRSNGFVQDVSGPRASIYRKYFHSGRDT